MTSLTENEISMRTDSRGRVRVCAERRQALLEEFDRSGLSGAAFARLIGVSYPTFMSWLAKRKRGAASFPQKLAPAAPVAFLEASLPELRSSPALVVELPGGARLEIHSPHQLAMAAELLRLCSQPRQRPC